MVRMLVATFALCLGIGVAAAQDRQLYMLDFVFLNDGITLEDRDAFNAKSSEIAGRYGIAHIATLDPLAITDGPQDLDRVDIWTVPSQDAWLAWGEDADFKALHAELAKVHDLDNLTLYFASEVAPPMIAPGQAYHLELFTFVEEGFDFDAFATYVQTVDQIAADHGIQRRASLGGLVKIIGSGPNADWLNLYSVPGPNEYDAMAKDPRNDALDGAREALFVKEMIVLGAFMAK